MLLSVSLLATLGLIAILGPFGTDVYLPALPQMAQAMHTTPSGIQLVITTFSFGMAAGQLVWGPASDRIGRRWLLVLGPALVAIGCFISAGTSSLPLLLASNALIGVAASVGMVCGRAMISDIAADNRAARGFAMMGMVTGLGPVIGPLGGAALLVITDWRGIYIWLGGFAGVLALIASIRLRETLAPERRHSGGLIALARAAGKILTNRNYLLHATLLWAGFGMLISYIAASPFIVEKIFGFSPTWYTVDFAVNGVGMMLTGAISAAIMGRVGPNRQILIGVSMLAAAAVILGIAVLTGNINPPMIFTAFFLVPSAMALLFGSATAMGLREVRHLAGTALALQGSIQFVFGGVLAALVGIGGELAVWPLALVFAGCAALAVVSYAAKPKM